MHSPSLCLSLTEFGRCTIPRSSMSWRDEHLQKYILRAVMTTSGTNRKLTEKESQTLYNRTMSVEVDPAEDKSPAPQPPC